MTLVPRVRLSIHRCHAFVTMRLIEGLFYENGRYPFVRMQWLFKTFCGILLCMGMLVNDPLGGWLGPYNSFFPKG